MENDSQKGSSLSMDSLSKFKKESFSEKETLEMNDILNKLGRPNMDQFRLSLY